MTVLYIIVGPSYLNYQPYFIKVSFPLKDSDGAEEADLEEDSEDEDDDEENGNEDEFIGGEFNEEVIIIQQSIVIIIFMKNIFNLITSLKTLHLLKIIFI